MNRTLGRGSLQSVPAKAGNIQATAPGAGEPEVGNGYWAQSVTVGGGASGGYHVEKCAVTAINNAKDLQ